MPSAKIPDGTAPAAGTRQPNSIQLFHGTAALGGRTPHRLPAGNGAPLPGKRPPTACSRGGAAPSSSWKSGGDAPPGRCRWWHRSLGYVKIIFPEKLTLADVAAVFNFRQLLSQLFGKYSDSGFVEIHHRDPHRCGKEMLEQGDLKVYEIAEKLGMQALSIFQGIQKGQGAQPAGIPIKYLKSGFYEGRNSLLICRNFFRLPALSPCQEHTAWQGCPYGQARFLQAGEAALQTPIAPLPLSLWLDFTHTGRRTPWEDGAFPPGWLCALVSAECVEHKGRFLDEIAIPYGRSARKVHGSCRYTTVMCGTPRSCPAGHHPPHRGYLPPRPALFWHDPGTYCPMSWILPRRASRRDGAGAGRPHPDALFYKPLLVDGQRRRAYV